ncbi:MAG TPA: thiamine phosphate synthase [Myxococcaceae bacterium]
MPLPRLIVITDWALGRERVLAVVDAALSVSAEVAVQHRHPDATGRAFLEEARALRAVVSRHPGRRLFVNGRLDVALLVDADLHLPASAPLAAEVRPFLPVGRLVSAAVHSEEEARAAAGADLALISPVFPPGSKPEDARVPLGPGGFEALRAVLPCPAFALGGVTAENAGRLSGAAGAAAIGAVMRASDPSRAVAALLAALCSAPG